MIALDTNVVVRFLVEDDEKQTARAARAIEKATARGGKCFVADVVVAETAWVLSRSYRFRPTEIAEVLRKLLGSAELIFQSADALDRALDAYAAGKGDLADYLIREVGRAAGATTLLTFDAALVREAGFKEP